MTKPPMNTGAKTLLSLLLCAVGVRGVDGVVGVLPRVRETSPTAAHTELVPIMSTEETNALFLSLISSGMR